MNGLLPDTEFVCHSKVSTIKIFNQHSSHTPLKTDILDIKDWCGGLLRTKIAFLDAFLRLLDLEMFHYTSALVSLLKIMWCSAVLYF